MKTTLNQKSISMKPISDIDYVELYAEKMKHDKSIFKQQKELIEAQLNSSSDLSKKMFSGNFKLFKSKAREYLRAVGLLK